jgi:hypothetical protein
MLTLLIARATESRLLLLHREGCILHIRHSSSFARAVWLLQRELHGAQGLFYELMPSYMQLFARL